MKKFKIFLTAFLIIGVVTQTSWLFARKPRVNNDPWRWTKSFNLEKCQFSVTGENQYFKLIPGYQLILKNREGTHKLVITVLKDTKKIGRVTTRVIKEREMENGKVTEVSRNYYAICKNNNSVFYFGEDVDIYKGDGISHSGSWRAFEKGARPGLMMPGILLLGSRYYDEIAPGIAMDRAEIISNTETVKTPAGIFTNCLLIRETNPLERGEKEYKIYAPGVGPVKDGDLLLVKYEMLNKK